MTNSKPLRAAIIGCGLIADQHMSQLKALGNCEVVAVCDKEELMAVQLADRFDVKGVYVDADEMLERARPDVVHITTYPQSHHSLGMRCLEANCHIYVEKPFTVTYAEATDLMKVAERKGLRVTVGHNLQFSPEALRMREVIRSGYLGGPPVHLECTQCFSHSDPTYGKAVLGDPAHWVRRLPGSLLHNLISHGIGKLAEFLSGDRPEVIAWCSPSPYLVRSGQGDIVDEVRALIRDEREVTASFVFTTQMEAGSNELRIHGPRGSVTVDSTYRTVTRTGPAKYKSYLRYFLSPLQQAREMALNSYRSGRLFARKQFHMDYGMRELMRQFYGAIRSECPDPLPAAEILRTARIMESIFDQIPRKQ